MRLGGIRRGLSRWRKGGRGIRGQGGLLHRPLRTLVVGRGVVIWMWWRLVVVVVVVGDGVGPQLK